MMQRRASMSSSSSSWLASAQEASTEPAAFPSEVGSSAEESDSSEKAGSQDRTNQVSTFSRFAAPRSKLWVSVCSTNFDPFLDRIFLDQNFLDRIFLEQIFS
jgi:hypothetical protein